MSNVLRKHTPSAHRWVGYLAVACALLVLAGCGGGASGGPVKTVTQQQTTNQLTIALEAPERPQLLAEQEVLVTLTDARGVPVEGAEVWLALIMPTMQMSSNEPDAAPAGNGRYRAKAIFTMSGIWNLEVHAT
ncbi:MAG TPA: FixH family protein, partial [Roseiflexaceae bacterium]